ncbi:hypothetical protein [Mesorhizobium temperatum]|uniref:hypothetical protein n=1 Tax=Mesorhizobium temperatum TaxID=241416 RepID=UPI00142DFD1D|nr:hypothetical protein [Mesorhizobium temperatum]
MKADMSAYGVTELAPEEASAISGGLFWGVVWAAVTLLAFVAATIAEGVVRDKIQG